MNTNIKDNVQGNVKFQYYRDGSLWYVTQTGLVFPVPIDDIGNATFNDEEKALLMMRYIRKYVNSLAAVA